jgi:ribonuclease BN (tRNA processing enzyme)
MRSLLLFTHLHHDHTQGLPFFGPIFHPQNTLHIFGPRPSEHRDLEAVLGSVYESPVSPIGLPLLKSRVFIEQVREGDVIVLNDADAPPQLLPVHEVPEELPRDAVVVRIHHGYHHPRTGIFVYRVEYEGRSVVLATDTEGYVGGDRRLIEFARGADLLVHDAEYDEEEYAAPGKVRQGWGHSTWRMAVEVAQAAGVGQLLLTHHSPRHDDEYLDGMEAKAQAVFPNTRMAYEGLVVEL